jgi:pimeloyl-ACP methyl ester carboxylesterase
MRPLIGLLLSSAAAAGCVGAPRQVGYAGPPPAEPEAVVFVLNGVGDFRATSDALRRVVGEDGLPLHVQTFEWSHGYGRVLADHVDFAHCRREGARLAAEVLCYRRPQAGGPPLPVYLLAHSGGCAVALAAAEQLPPGALERVVLLSPSVSAEYDLRPALRCPRRGIDVFHSDHDRAYLGVAVGIFGTADRRWTSAAGRVGFQVPATAQDPLFLKLRQYPWHPSAARAGHDGGHFGAHDARFLRASVVPLLRPDPVTPGR